MMIAYAPRPTIERMTSDISISMSVKPADAVWRFGDLGAAETSSLTEDVVSTPTD